jgi:hypothetical protein
MWRKIALAMTAAGAIGIAASSPAPVIAGTLQVAPMHGIAEPASSVELIHHRRWRHRHWRWGSWGWGWGRPCVWVHTRPWSRWRCR